MGYELRYRSSVTQVAVKYKVKDSSRSLGYVSGAMQLEELRVRKTTVPLIHDFLARNTWRAVKLSPSLK